jgi:hypothetical protein
MNYMVINATRYPLTERTVRAVERRPKPVLYNLRGQTEVIAEEYAAFSRVEYPPFWNASAHEAVVETVMSADVQREMLELEPTATTESCPDKKSQQLAKQALNALCDVPNRSKFGVKLTVLRRLLSVFVQAGPGSDEAYANTVLRGGKKPLTIGGIRDVHFISAKRYAKDALGFSAATYHELENYLLRRAMDIDDFMDIAFRAACKFRAFGFEVVENFGYAVLREASVARLRAAVLRKSRIWEEPVAESLSLYPDITHAPQFIRDIMTGSFMQDEYVANAVRRVGPVIYDSSPESIAVAALLNIARNHCDAHNGPRNIPIGEEECAESDYADSDYADEEYESDNDDGDDDDYYEFYEFVPKSPDQSLRDVEVCAGDAAHDATGDDFDWLAYNKSSLDDIPMPDIEMSDLDF